ncbi:MAG: patatin family protein [Clostridiales bacterium]|nr:patatin family protein [Clostridiales bacterium]
MSSKVFSGIDDLPNGTATDEVTPGCMVLEGGAFRGLYGEGVLDALMEAGINMECTVGVSAGAMNGVNYVSGQIGRSARCNLRYRHDSRYISSRKVFIYGGPINFDFVTFHLPDDPLDMSRFFDKKRRYIAVATDCRTGKPVYFDRDTCSDIFTAVRASASMPYMSRIVMLDGYPCLDGGCSVKVPYQWALDNDYKKLVIVRTRPDDWRYPDEKAETKARVFYHEYPKFAMTLAKSHERYNHECDEMNRLHAEGRVFMISPSRLIPIKRMESDMEKLGEWYYLGYNDGKAAIESLKAYLNR